MVTSEIRLEDFIKKEDVEKPRCLSEYIVWFERKLSITKEFKESLREQNLLHKEIAKNFYEELFPVYRLLQRKVNQWHDVLVTPFVGDQPLFDVKIESKQNDIPVYIQITVADIDELEHARMEYFVDNRYVELTGKVIIEKTKAGKIIKIDDSDTAEFDVTMLTMTNQLTNAISSKTSKGPYPNNTALLVYFNKDVLTWRSKDLLKWQSMLTSQNEAWKSSFVRLYIIGAAGNNFLEIS